MKSLTSLRRPTRYRTIAAAAAVVGCVLTMAACSASSSSPSSPSSSGGGALTVGVNAGLTTLNPQPFGADNSVWVRSVYEPLVSLQNGQSVNVLARSTELAKNGKSLTITLQPNVKYSDGTPFNADAVIWNVGWMKEPSTGAQGIAEWAQVTATKINNMTVKLSFPQPMPSIYGLLDEAVMVKPGAPGKGIGTGPFMVSTFAPGTSLTLVRNPDYWDKANAAKLASLTFQNFPDPSTAAVALQSGTIGMTEPEVQQISQLKAAGMQSITLPATGNQDILINTAKKPLNDVRVRQALSLAFNRTGFNSSILGGLVKPAYSIFPPSSPAYTEADNSGQQNIGAARKLLAEAGVSKLSLTIDAPAVLPLTSFLPVYQQDLAKIGVTLTIHQVDTASWAEEAATGTFPELLVHAYSFGNSDPALLFTAFPFRPDGNAEHYDNQDYKEMVSAAAVDLNPADRIAEYQAIDRFVQQQAFVIPIAPIPFIMMYSPSYTAPTVLEDGLLEYNNVTMK